MPRSGKSDGWLWEETGGARPHGSGRSSVASVARAGPLLTMGDARNVHVFPRPPLLAPYSLAKLHRGPDGKARGAQLCRAVGLPSRFRPPRP